MKKLLNKMKRCLKKVEQKLARQVRNYATKLQQKKQRIKAAEVHKAHQAAPKKAKDLKSQRAYFQAAKSWADDIYTATIISRNRYKAAFMGVLGLSVILVFCLMVMTPLQRTQLVVVHQGPSGYTWLSTTKRGYKPVPSWAQVQSEIAHYVQTREAYDPMLYSHQTQLVKLLSSSMVFGQYEMNQAGTHKGAPINLLGTKGYRTVTINNILPLDSVTKNVKGQVGTKHINLAQVNFVVHDHLFGASNIVNTPYTALISWSHTGTPQDPQSLMENWDGFVVTKYVVQPVNLGDGH